MWEVILQVTCESTHYSRMVPLLLPINAHMTSFHTSFCIHDEEFAFVVHNVPPPNETGKVSLKDAKLQCDFELRNLLRGFEPVLQQRLNQSMDLPTFVMELKDILENIVCVRSKDSLLGSTFYTRIYTEINRLGWEHLVWLGPNLSLLHFRIFDDVGREHIIEVALPPGYPEARPVISADLPCTLDLQWQVGANLEYILEQYKQVIGKYQDFWAVMEDIDKKVCVMEPEHPSRGNKFRRIALGNHSSLSITVDPSEPRSLPECRFFGSDMAITPLRKRLNCNIRRWKTDRMLLTNLQDVLEMTFPSPQDTVHEDISADCAICYAFRLSDGDIPNGERKTEGSIPDRACDNVNCGRPFHTTCLLEWLRSITTTRQSFNVLFGSCPYCSHPIAVKAALT